MIDRNTPSDPRLRERRGDLVGRNALLFALVVLLVVGGAAAWLLSDRPRADTATASPSPSPSGLASPSARPSMSASPRPSASPSPSAPPAVVRHPVDTPAEITVSSEVVGTVTAAAPRYRPRLAGERAPEGSRFAVVSVRYDATGALSYRAADWLVVDVDGGRHQPSTVQPGSALGAAELEAGGSAEGAVAFQVPADSDVAAIVLRPQGIGRDLLAFMVP